MKLQLTAILSLCLLTTAVTYAAERKIKRTKQGLRLYSRPVAETESMCQRAFEASNLSAVDANEMIDKFAAD